MEGPSFWLWEKIAGELNIPYKLVNMPLDSLLEIKYNPQFYAFGLNRDLSGELKQNISVSVLENTEGMDWKVLLSEYDLQ